MRLQRGTARHDARIIIREGEENRLIAATLGADRRDAPELMRAQRTPPSREAAASSSTPGGRGVVGYVAGGTGAALVVASLYLGYLAKVQSDELHGPSGCKPLCSEEEVDSVRSKITWANVMLGSGVVALGVGTWFVIDNNAATTHQSIVSTLRLALRPTAAMGVFASAQATF